jgi:RNA polymerase sigma-B factor
MSFPNPLREQMIADHHYLCRRAARKFLRDGVERNDLEQVAAIGLIKAVDRFDPAHGTPFAAYAWALVLGELMHYVRDCERLLRAPRRLRELERRWLAGERELWTVLGRKPSDAEIAEYVGIGAAEQTEVRRYRRCGEVLSMDALGPYEQGALSYTIDAEFERVALESGFARLSALEREILKEIYERDTPIVELASRLGYSRRHLTRLHKAALQKLASYARLASA